jgi:hypothetical protein
MMRRWFGGGRRGRTKGRVKGQMNKLEAAYGTRLKLRMMAGEVKEYTFEPPPFILAGSMKFTPDFEVVRPDGSHEYHEVKAMWMSKKTGKEYPGWQEDAKVKFKSATGQYPQFRWYLAAGRNDGSWEVTEWRDGRKVKPCFGLA